MKHDFKVFISFSFYVCVFVWLLNLEKKYYISYLLVWVCVCVRVDSKRAF